MTTHQHPAVHPVNLTIRSLLEREVPEADRIFRLAFGTFLDLPDPLTFWADTAHLETRWRADPTRVFAAEVAGELVGSNVATHWGSVGFFGPLTIRPDLWDQGIAKLLMEPILGCFATWGVRHAGLFTFPQSPKHLSLPEVWLLSPLPYRDTLEAGHFLRTRRQLVEIVRASGKRANSGAAGVPRGD